MIPVLFRVQKSVDRRVYLVPRWLAWTLVVYLVLALFLLARPAFSASQQTSSTLASAMITDARAYLNEDTADFWTDAELLQWLNDGMVDLVSQSHCLQTTESIDLAASTIEYSITSNYITVSAVHYVNASSAVSGLIKGNPRSVGSVLDVDEPAYWYEWAGKVGVYPALDSRTTETITVYIVTRPTALTSTDAVTTPAIYDKALVYYIVAQALFKDRMDDKANNYLRMYQAEIDRYRADFNENAQAATEPVR